MDEPASAGAGEPDEAGNPALVLDLDGFEGPIDLLLKLAREQKVDLSRISILALAEQYLAFIVAARGCASKSRPTIWLWRLGWRF